MLFTEIFFFKNKTPDQIRKKYGTSLIFALLMICLGSASDFKRKKFHRAGDFDNLRIRNINFKTMELSRKKLNIEIQKS